MQVPFLMGERIYLRPLDPCDLEQCLRWINDPVLRVNLGRHRPMGRVMETEWLAGQYKGESELSFAVVLIDGDRHIGNVGLHGIDWKNRLAEFGILIGEPDAWDQGYGTEAGRLMLAHGFDEIGLHRIMLRVFPFNERAIRVYEKLGFQQEGRLRESLFRGGAFHDTLLMSMLEYEWRER